MIAQQFQIVIYHKSDREGAHNSIFAQAATMKKLMADWDKYMQRPEWMRSFTKHNQIFVMDGGQPVACLLNV